MLCKDFIPGIGDYPTVTTSIFEGGIGRINSGTNNFVDFTSSIYIGIAGFGKEFNFRKIEVVCFDKSGSQIPNVRGLFEYEGNVPQNVYVLQSYGIKGVLNRYFTSESPYKFILMLDNHETDSWFLQVLNAKAFNDREIKIDSQCINFSEKL